MLLKSNAEKQKKEKDQCKDNCDRRIRTFLAKEGKKHTKKCFNKKAKKM